MFLRLTSYFSLGWKSHENIKWMHIYEIPNRNNVFYMLYSRRFGCIPKYWLSKCYGECCRSRSLMEILNIILFMMMTWWQFCNCTFWKFKTQCYFELVVESTAPPLCALTDTTHKLNEFHLAAVTAICCSAAAKWINSFSIYDEIMFVRCHFSPQIIIELDARVAAKSYEKVAICAENLLQRRPWHSYFAIYRIM